MRVEPVMAMGPVARSSLLDAGLVDDLARPLHVPAEQVGGVVVDEEHVGPDVEPLPGGADDEGRLAALGDRDDDIVLLHARLLDLTPAEIREVLESLHGLDQREVPAGHDADAQVLHSTVGAGPRACPSDRCEQPRGLAPTQNRRHAASRRMLSRPVAPQPVK